ncbi:OmpA family protein [Helicobacter saguini]|uniref:OmpA family protein n=1 Tax=Helicobacter saguini TaxID=1548018 RepID=A0A347VPE3_9HELI|nr:OmpA family protein [Helicobacter saguini]MWV61400.1 OmpA family protein [Helicobacter saguini]MWV67932.1 OmpA family protein [Helicobacter saguini]MWV70601.1 OmpA family protein [Helicobacter saguini]MWV72505.1 OmpA family protein [Helicobacter saguini]TLD94751.1 hypothetical protein LS64_004330 [Helicobacter saguini]
MEEKGSHWITISDMMSGIMMIFMLIAIAFMVTLEQDKKQLEVANDKMRELAQNYQNLQQELYKDLMKEFGGDLNAWNAFIDEDTTIRFQKQDILFDVGQKKVKERFARILDDFFPRFIKILNGEKYRDFIEEIRIEGHTSKDWEGSQSLERRYLGNAELSQERAFEVLKYCFSLPSIADKREWLITLLRANGVSFAKPLATDELSRRVEFQATFKANEQILKILQASE